MSSVLVKKKKKDEGEKKHGTIHIAYFAKSM